MPNKQPVSSTAPSNTCVIYTVNRFPAVLLCASPESQLLSCMWIIASSWKLTGHTPGRLLKLYSLPLVILSHATRGLKLGIRTVAKISKVLLLVHMPQVHTRSPVEVGCYLSYVCVCEWGQNSQLSTFPLLNHMLVQLSSPASVLPPLYSYE